MAYKQAETSSKSIDEGIWYQSAISGMWYTDAGAAGSICAVRIDGKTAYLPDSVDQLVEDRKFN